MPEPFGILFDKRLTNLLGTALKNRSSFLRDSISSTLCTLVLRALLESQCMHRVNVYLCIAYASVFHPLYIAQFVNPLSSFIAL